MDGALTNQLLIQKIEEKFPGSVIGQEEQYGILVITIDRQDLISMLNFLKDSQGLNFNFLTDICGVHYPDNEKPLGVVYHLHNMVQNIRIRLKVFLKQDDLHIPTATSLFKSANWMERETYDFYGILFDGHPDLRRILNVDDMIAFPLRKEFPLEDPNRRDKHDEFFGR